MLNRDQIKVAAADWFLARGYTLRADPTPADLCAEKNAERWYISALGDQDDPFSYLHAFEDGMADLLEANHWTDEGPPHLGLALAFSSTLQRLDHSYRRALKKYSNSIVFTDLNIHLLFVRDDRSIEHLAPEAVNPFLRKLNRYIIENDPHAT